MSDKVYIFSNGTQFMDWQSSNCERCKKSTFNDASIGVNDLPKCEIEYALMYALMDDGTVTEEIKKRSGYESSRYVWPCNETEWTKEWMNEVQNEND